MPIRIGADDHVNFMLVDHPGDIGIAAVIFNQVVNEGHSRFRGDQLAGRLGGAEMARREKQISGSIPLSGITMSGNRNENSID